MTRFTRSWTVLVPTKKRTQKTPRLPRKPSVQHEEMEQIDLIFWARKPETLTIYPELAWLYAIPNGGKRHVVVAMKMKAAGAKSGVYDLFLPVARRGFHGLYIEMKWGNNDLSDEQKKFRQFVIIEGYRTATCYSSKEARQAIEWYLMGNEKEFKQGYEDYQ